VKRSPKVLHRLREQFPESEWYWDPKVHCWQRLDGAWGVFEELARSGSTLPLAQRPEPVYRRTDTGERVEL
jgi:hypothetical protein